MDEDSEDEFWYPAVDDILTLHEEIIAEDPEATPGIENLARIGFVIDYVKDGHYGEVPETIHEKHFISCVSLHRIAGSPMETSGPL